MIHRMATTVPAIVFTLAGLTVVAEPASPATNRGKQLTRHYPSAQSNRSASIGSIRDAFREINKHGTAAARTSTKGVATKVTGSSTETRNSRLVTKRR